MMGCVLSFHPPVGYAPYLCPNGVYVWSALLVSSAAAAGAAKVHCHHPYHPKVSYHSLFVCVYLCGQGVCRQGVCEQGVCGQGVCRQGVCGQGVCRQGVCGQGVCRQGVCGQGVGCMTKDLCMLWSN